jgi:segregation and condensation protein B
MPEGADITGLLQELKDHYANRGVHLMAFEDRWAFRTAPDLAPKFHIERDVVRKMSRAAIETLAIIAYHQPVTRAEIEEIRGVVISKGTLDMLLEIGWIRPKGRRETPGRPVTWATTDQFLEHFGLESCDALPGVEELKAAGLLDARANIATLGTSQGLPGGAPVAEEEDEEGNISDMLAQTDEEIEAAEGAADDAYEDEVLRRAEGEEAATSAEESEDAEGDADDDDDDDFEDDDFEDEDGEEVGGDEDEGEGEGEKTESSQGVEDEDEAKSKPKAAASS